MTLTDELTDQRADNHSTSDPFADAFAVTGSELTISEGTAICTSGEQPEAWWYVVDGFADVTNNGHYLGTIGPGETIGEISLLDGRERTATVIAKSEMVLITQSATEFSDVLRQTPELVLQLAHQLASRLRDLTSRTVATANTPTPHRDRPAGAPSPLTTKRVEFDPSATGYFDDPSVQLNAIREQERVHYMDRLGGYMLTRYEDVHALGRDRRLQNGITHALSTSSIDAERAQAEASRFSNLTMLRRDGTDHTRLRRLVSRAFTPKAIREWRTKALNVSTELLDNIEAKGGADLIADYALRLPVQIISEMLGMPTDHNAQMRAWSHQLAKTLDPLSAPEEREASVVASAEMAKYVEEVYDLKSGHPDEGIFSQLIQAEDDGDRLSRDEVIANVMLLYIAGHETTTNLIGNGVVELLRHPDQLRLVHTNADLDANLVEEVLRFNSPVQSTRRIPIEDITIGDTDIPAGTVMVLSATAANRDPRKWGPTADQFLVNRANPNDQVSFGGGPHFCLGAALARLEGQVALPRLMRRFPTMRTTVDPVFEPRMILRGVGSIEVEIA